MLNGLLPSRKCPKISSLSRPWVDMPGINPELACLQFADHRWIPLTQSWMHKFGSLAVPVIDDIHFLMQNEIFIDS